LATREDIGLDLFVTMSSIWRKHVPPALVHESPYTLTRILELGLTSPGISHSAMRPQLGLNQPQMSKIATQLLDGGLIRVTPMESDRRVKLITATAAGSTLLSSLKMEMNALLSVKGVRLESSRQPKLSRGASRRKVKSQPEETPFWDFERLTSPDEKE
jgi:DNA-binding MarR family transcriptional regulator